MTLADPFLSVAALTGGESEPSARFRIRQYIEGLSREGVLIKDYTALFGQYPPSSRLLRPSWGVLALGDAARRVYSARKADIVLIQRELISSLITFERFTRRPRIFDVDDAIWVNRGASFTRKLGEQCDGFICGNRYIADHFAKFNENIYVIPTGIDTSRYVPKKKRPNDVKKIIGWSGTSSNLSQLLSIELVISAFLKKNPDVRLRVICDKKPNFTEIEPKFIEYVPWSNHIEVTALQDLSVGLMPLEDNEWTRGKCSFKMLTYMACGVPVIVSPVGMNRDVLKLGAVGYGANSEVQWFKALEATLGNSQGNVEMGKVGREIVQREYSVTALVPKLAAVLKSTADQRRAYS